MAATDTTTDTATLPEIPFPPPKTSSDIANYHPFNAPKVPDIYQHLYLQNPIELQTKEPGPVFPPEKLHTIKVVSSDGYEFFVPSEVLKKYSKTMNELLTTCDKVDGIMGIETGVELREINGSVMVYLLHFMMKQYYWRNVCVPKIPEFNTPSDPEICKGIIIAANFLEC